MSRQYGRGTRVLQQGRSTGAISLIAAEDIVGAELTGSGAQRMLLDPLTVDGPCGGPAWEALLVVVFDHILIKSLPVRIARPHCHAGRQRPRKRGSRSSRKPSATTLAARLRVHEIAGEGAKVRHISVVLCGETMKRKRCRSPAYRSTNARGSGVITVSIEHPSMVAIPGEMGRQVGALERMPHDPCLEHGFDAARNFFP